MIIRDWDTFKDLIDRYQVNVHWVDLGNIYSLTILVKKQLFEHVIIKESHITQTSDFETNYKTELKHLDISHTVIAGIESYAIYTPAAGKKIIITEFYAEAPYSTNSACKLIWDFGGANEKVIWSTRGSSRMPFNYIIDSNETDGTKKLAISCDNGELVPLLMSTRIEFGEV